MTQQFVSIELARLYESQGYLEDALTMYKTLDEEGGHSNGSEVPAAINRLETALAGQDEPVSLSCKPDLEEKIAQLREPLPERQGELELEDASEPISDLKTDLERRIALLLDKWLMLMVVQKRARLFKAIRARL